VRGWLPDVLMVRQSQKPWVVLWPWTVEANDAE